MFIGVFLYSFLIGSLSSLLARIDLRSTRFNQLLNILVEIKKEYKIGRSFFSKIKNHLKYGKK